MTPAQTRRKAKEVGGNTQDKATSAKVAEPPPEQRLESLDRTRQTAMDTAIKRLTKPPSDSQSRSWLPSMATAMVSRHCRESWSRWDNSWALCLHASTMAWKHVIHGRQSPGDVRAVAITLFLECSRSGVTAEELLEGIPF